MSNLVAASLISVDEAKLKAREIDLPKAGEIISMPTEVFLEWMNINRLAISEWRNSFVIVSRAKEDHEASDG